MFTKKATTKKNTVAKNTTTATKNANVQKFIVRTDRAGVFFGEIDKLTDTVVTMTNVRKVWYWSGAAAVEELAMSGVNDPANTKLTVTVPTMVIAAPIQVIPCTDKAVECLDAIPEWKA